MNSPRFTDKQIGAVMRFISGESPITIAQGYPRAREAFRLVGEFLLNAPRIELEIKEMELRLKKIRIKSRLSMARHRVSYIGPIRDKEICDRYVSGESAAMIAKDFDMKPFAVYMVVRKYGLTRNCSEDHALRCSGYKVAEPDSATKTFREQRLKEILCLKEGRRQLKEVSALLRDMKKKQKV